MKLRYVLGMALLVSTFLLPCNLLATSWAYPFVVWDGFTYEVTDQYVTKVGNEIGHVTTYSDMETYSGNFQTVIEKEQTIIQSKVLIQMKRLRSK